MAAGSWTVEYGKYLGYITDWEAKAVPASNLSKVTVKISLSHYAIGLGARTITCTVAGEKKTATTPTLSQSSTSYKSTDLLATFTFDVPHNDDGTRSFKIETLFSTAPFTYSGIEYKTMESSKTVTADSIPRASTISALTSSVEINGTNTVKVTISRKVSTYTHTVVFSLGSKKKTYTDVGTSKSYTIPLSWLEEMPDNDTATAKCTVTTYNGDEKVGSAASKTFKVVCPDSIIPTMDAPSVTRIDNKVPPDWDIYLQHVSGVQIKAMNAAGVYGSTITTYEIGCDLLSTDADTLTVDAIMQSGDVSYFVKITDSRGKSAEYTGTIHVEAYSAPKITLLTAVRSDENGASKVAGTYIAVTARAEYTAIQSNALKIAYEIAEPNGSVIYSDELTDGITVPIGPISTDKAYVVRVEVSDLFFTPNPQYAHISTTKYYMHFKKGGKRGVAFGKAAEYDDVVEVADDMEFWYKGTELTALIRKIIAEG